MTTPPLPSPHEPLVDKDGKVSEVWYRYLAQGQLQASASASSLADLATMLTLVAYSPFADQSDQEAGTGINSVVASAYQQYHNSAAKAWGSVSMAGTVATVDAGYNVNTVASTATGYLRVDLTVPFSSTAYVVVPSASVVDSGVANRSVTISSSLGLATSTFTLISQLGDGTNADSDSYYFVCYGDQ
jgi:hypothetical protein